MHYNKSISFSFITFRFFLIDIRINDLEKESEKIKSNSNDVTRELTYFAHAHSILININIIDRIALLYIL